MNLKRILMATTMVAGLAVAGASAQAAVCPPAGTAPICNLIITFGPGGGITTSGPGGNYDGVEDALIGVVNNSGSTITSFKISGTGIFGFDSDGIDTYTGASNAMDLTGYGGPLGYFTTSSLDTGTVSFIGGIPDGGSTYFSLEESIVLSQLPVITAAPEPASLALLGVGLAAVGIDQEHTAGQQSARYVRITLGLSDRLTSRYRRLEVTNIS
jgi:hypothetical protein